MIDAGSEIPKIGFVGAGSMGEPMVERLLAAGWPVTVYARKADVRERLTARGAEAAGSIAEAVGDAPVVVLCPFSSDQLEAIALGSDGVLAHAPDGAAVVVHTTTSPAVLRCLADAAEREIEIIDAPVSGTADAIRAGALAVVLGGSVAGTERIEAVLRSYANSTVRVGELGDAALVKLLNNSIFAAHVQIAQSAVSSAQAAGVDPETFVSVLGALSGNSKAFDYIRHLGLDAFPKSERYLRKDVATLEEVSDGAGIDIAFLRDVIDRGPLKLSSG